MNIALAFIIIGILFLLIDGIWLSFVLGPLFKNMVENIQKEDFKMNYLGAIGSYATLITGCVLSTKMVNMQGPIWKQAIPAGLWGILSYGVFDFTNLAIFRNYSPTLAVVDTLWGGVVCWSSTAGALYILDKIDKMDKMDKVKSE